jgi:hypothetical protein
VSGTFKGKNARANFSVDDSEVYQFYLNTSDFRNDVGSKDLEAIFNLRIIATSRDLKSYCEVVTQWARNRSYDPVVQDEFPV